LRVPPDIALAYAGVLKAPPKQTFERGIEGRVAYCPNSSRDADIWSAGEVPVSEMK
jgi:hypothetical protein